MSLCVPVVSPEFMPHISVDMGVYERVPDPVYPVSVSLSVSSSVCASECECVMGLKPTDVLEQVSTRSSRHHTCHCPLWALNGSQPWAHPSSRGWALTHGYSMGFWEATAGEDGLLVGGAPGTPSSTLLAGDGSSSSVSGNGLRRCEIFADCDCAGDCTVTNAGRQPGADAAVSLVTWVRVPREHTAFPRTADVLGIFTRV